MNGNIGSLNDNLINEVLESALEVGGKTPIENSGNISTATKDLIRKCSKMLIKTMRQNRSG